jgi:hypothetical protein
MNTQSTPLKCIALLTLALAVSAGCKSKASDGQGTSTEAPGSSASAASVSPAAQTATAAKDTAQPRTITEITKRAVADVKASSEQACHGARYAFDGWPTTSWTEDSPGDGTGEWVEATLVPGTFVEYVDVSGGWFTKRSNRLFDAWDKNNVFQTMKLTWDGGEETVEFNRFTDKGRRKRVKIGKAVKSLKLTAVAVNKGTYNDLCLDDIWIFGSIAGAPPADPAVCSDAPPAACPDGLFMAMASAALPSKTREVVEKLGSDSTLYGVEIANDKKLGVGILARNKCQAEKIAKFLGPEVGAAQCTALDLQAFVDAVTAESFCDKYVSCMCGIAMGLKGADKEAEAQTSCTRARALITNNDNNQCRNDLLEVKTWLNVLRAFNANTPIPCTCQS